MSARIIMLEKFFIMFFGSSGLANNFRYHISVTQTPNSILSEIRVENKNFGKRNKYSLFVFWQPFPLDWIQAEKIE